LHPSFQIFKFGIFKETSSSRAALGPRLPRLLKKRASLCFLRPSNFKGNMAAEDLGPLQAAAQEWIESITARKFSGATWADGLKDGVLLCLLINTIRPGAIPKFNLDPKMAIKKQENVSLALKAMRAFGMKEFELFSTLDLCDEKNLKVVTQSIHALGRLMQSPPFAELGLPKLGKRVVEKQVREFTEEQLREAAAAVSVLNLGGHATGLDGAKGMLEGKAFASPSTRNLMRGGGGSGGGGGGGGGDGGAAVPPAEASAEGVPPAAPAGAAGGAS
jgi:hypothetical protein